MQNIGLNTSLAKTGITPDKFVTTSEQMTYELPTIFS